MGPKEIRAREPHIRGTAALDVPSTGIFPPKIWSGRTRDLPRTMAQTL